MLPRLSLMRACKAYSNTAGMFFNASAAVMQQQRLTYSRSVPVLSGLLRTLSSGDLPCSSRTVHPRLLRSPSNSALPVQKAAGDLTTNSNRAHRACNLGCAGHNNSSIVSSSWDWGYTSGSSSSGLHWHGHDQRRMLSTSGGDTGKEDSTHNKPAEALPSSKIKSPASSSSSNSSGGAGSRNSGAGSSGSSSEEAKVQVPPAVAAGAAAAGEAVSKAAKATVKQASRLVKLVQTTSLSEATWLQLSSMWQSHSAAITAATAAAATAGVYQVFAAAAGHFVDMSDPSAYWSCVAASAAAVGLVGQQVRSSFTVDADRVYRISMRKLNRHAGLREVMGAPLAGSDVRLELVIQGTLFVQETLIPRRRAPRIHLMFQLTGPTSQGVVSVTAKKAFGSKYAFKTLMVELPGKTLTSQAAGAAAVSALSQAKAARSQAGLGAPQPDQQRSVQHSSSSSAQGDSSTSSSNTSSSSSSSSGSSAQQTSAAASSTGVNPARIYLIGSPAGSSCSSRTRHMSPGVLLEDLKEPLLYALKHNLPGYEAEDEFEGQLAWSTPHQDPDQLTLWDNAKAASKRVACQAYTAARTAGAAAAAAAGKAATLLKAKAAAGPASTSSTAASGGTQAAGSTAGSSSSGGTAGSSSSSGGTAGSSSSSGDLSSSVVDAGSASSGLGSSATAGDTSSTGSTVGGPGSATGGGGSGTGGGYQGGSSAVSSSTLGSTSGSGSSGTGSSGNGSSAVTSSSLGSTALSATPDASGRTLRVGSS